MKICRISRATLKRWVQRGIIVPFIKIGGIVRYDLDDVERRLRERSELPACR